MAKKRVIKIFDTTLRDGEQSPGATLTHNEKILIAQQLERLNVDIIEAGFPVASNDDFTAVKEIAQKVRKPTICALARCKKDDIDRAAAAIEPARRGRIHVFLATSPIHMKYKLQMTPSQVIAQAGEWVAYAKQFTTDVEFSPEDAGRSEPKFLHKVLAKVIDAGATTLNIPDTVGYTQPHEFGSLIKGIIEHTPNYTPAVTISAHCHDDLGLAVANSLAAVANGAGQVEGTINGIGERAGNASLEEVVMNLHAREKFFNARTRIRLAQIYNTSRMVSNFTSIPVQPNKAIVGKNAFAHEAGIHQHGILANRKVYEIMNPKTIGKETELVIGKHSGKAAVADFLKAKGFAPSFDELAEITSKIKELADKKKKVFSEDILAIARRVTKSTAEEMAIVKLDDLQITTGNKLKPVAVVKLIVHGVEVTGTSTGVGPIDAVSKAIQQALGNQFVLSDYSLRTNTGGTDALADVSISITSKNGQQFSGEALNEDITMASAEALLKCINKLMEEEYRKGTGSK